MKFQFYYEKLIDSEDYQKFVKENPLAFHSSGFFVLDLENNGKDNSVHFDMFLEKPKPKMFSFKVTGNVELLPVENFDPRIPEKLSMNYTFDLMNIKEKIEKKMQDEQIKGKLKKLLFSLQKLNKIDYLVINGFLDNMGMLKVTYDLSKKEITQIEKKSFLDMFKIIKK